MKTERLAILGAGGHGRVVADAALSAGWTEVQFFDDSYPDLSKSGEWQVAGRSGDFLQGAAQFDGAIIAIGENRARLALLQHLIAAGAPIISVVHPHASVSPRATIGKGCMISAGAAVTIGASVGDGSIINTGATVDHDCVLGEGVHIAPGANLSGNVIVGTNSWIGVGASIRQGITIGENVTIGAGAVVVSDIADGATAVGCPAKPRP